MKEQMIRRVTLIFALIAMTGCTWYGEYEHISSIPNGTPFNNEAETSTDVIWSGIRAEKDGWYVDGAVGVEVNGDLVGRNPYGRFKVGKDIKTWGD